MSQHHLFAPSSAHRWLACAPFVAVARRYNTPASYEAAEGTAAHMLASTCLQSGLDAVTVWQGVESIDVEEHTIPIDTEMRTHVQGYIDYVLGLGGGLEVEVKMEFRVDPDFGGTADALIWILDGKGILHVVDFKYGKGLRVAAENNAQMKSYALLALTRNTVMDIDKIVLHVYQPRMDNIDSWEMPASDLPHFAARVAEAIMQSRQMITWLDKGKNIDAYFVPGDHCTFCPHAANCVGLQQRAVQSAQKNFKAVSEVPTSNIEEILAEADLIDAWVAAVRKEAMDRAMKGEAFKRHKLVQKRAYRKWTDEEQVRAIGLDNLIDVYEPPTLRSVPQLEKAIGEKALVQLFGPLITSVSSGLTLVSVDDKREAVDPLVAPAEKARAVFTAINQE